MIKIFTDIVTRQHFDSDGNLFGSSMPQMFFRSKETVAWQLCANSFDLADDQSPEADWEKYTGFASAQGLGAYLTADNNYTHKLQGTLKTRIEAGSVTEIEAIIPSATQALLDRQGVVTLFNPDGSFEQFEYDGRAFGENNLVTFSITGGSTADSTYNTGVALDVNEACFMQSSLDPVLSDPASGLFVFEVTAYSEKLRSSIVYNDVREVNVAGLELAIFTVDGQTSIVRDIGRYVLGSFSIQSGIADTSLNPVVGTQRANDTVAYIYALLSGGFEVGFSQTADGGGDPWHGTQTAGDRYFRFRSVLVGGDWSESVQIPLQPLLYRAYASDNAGSDFTLTASNTLEYFADIYVLEAFLSPPTLTDFNNAGAVWLRWKGSKGDDGVTPHIDPTTGNWFTGNVDSGYKAVGEDGTSQFTKVAWASDNQGANFSLVPSASLKFRAEIVVDTDIAVPTLTDFDDAGAVWVQVIDDQALQLTSAAPEDLDTTASAGTGTTAARSDHVHSNAGLATSDDVDAVVARAKKMALIFG